MNSNGARRPGPATGLRGYTGVTLLAAALVAVALLCWLLYRIESERIATQQEQRETVRASLLAELLKSELRPVASDLRLLADGDGLRRYVETGSADALQAAVRRARFMSVGQPDYSQVRYFDTQGNEAFRIDQHGALVPREQLQTKIDRPFFQRANALPPGSLYISSFDLMMDNGALVVPHRPVLRFAVPVFNAAGERHGVYVINYLGANLIARLQSAAGRSGRLVRLLGGAGQWLKAAEPTMEWNDSLPERARFSLSVTDPALWRSIAQNPTGQLRDERGLFTWQRVAPQDIAGVTTGQLLSEEAFLVVASELTAAEWTALFAPLKRLMLITASGLTLLVLLTGWSLRGRRRAMLDMQATNLALEERVHERTVQLARSYESLQDRESLLEETGNLAKVGGWEFDPVSGEGTWTPEIARIHDLDPTVKPNRDLGLQFYVGESRARLEAALQASLADGTPYDLELEFVSDRGVQKWVRTISRPVMQDGRVVRMRGALQDVTERKQSELRLQAQLQRLHLLERTTRAIGERLDLRSILQVVIATLEEQMPLDFGTICLYDASDRSLTVAAVGEASSTLAAQLDMLEEARIPIDANGLSRCVLGQVVYEDDIANAQFPFPQKLAGGGLGAMVAAPLQVESQVFGVLVAARREAHSFSSSDCEFLRQMSEHAALAAHQAQLHQALQTAYEDLRNTQQAVMQQERLRVLGQMASGIAHDINNAISPIMLYTDSLLEREQGLSENAKQSLRIIQQAVSDVAETVSRMREFYRQRETQSVLQPVTLNTLVAQLRELTRARWETQPQQHGTVIDLQLDLAQNLPPANGIESEIREALTNLVFNAVDAMPGGGRLTIRTHAGPRNLVSVDVIDTGGGMDEETRRRCLEPFYTTKGERGTGLGLAMVYGVMQRHGGEIDIRSAPGAGTTIQLSFAVAEASAQSAVETQPPTPTGLTILLVDDDPILLRSLRETLEIDGHTILTANGGQLGIDAFRASLAPGGKPISVIITDLGMPHVDGRIVSRTAKELAPDTPVIMLTGWGERLLAEGHSVPHVDRVLGKPPRLRDLRSALAEMITRQAAGTLRRA
ncbi:MAG: ATP-binding protein [Steroidobacteraceae bacterium]